MKKTKTKLQSASEFDLEAGLDIPDFDFLETEVKDDRSPLTALKDGAIQGAKSQFTNPDAIRKNVLKALPSEYGQAYSQIDAIGANVRGLYDEATKNLKPAIKDLKRSTNRVLPKIEGALPKTLSEKLKNWAKIEPEDAIRVNRESMREDAIAMQLGEIFRAQTEQAAEQRERDDTKDALRQGIEQLRYKDQFEQLDLIRQNTGKLAAYQDKILIAYQRKSLELQHRQYFATVDLLEATREAGGHAKEKLDAIIKNTGLPEFVKITNSERFRELSKTKILDDLRSSLFGDATDFFKKTVDNVTQSLRRKVSSAIGDFSSAASAMDLATSAAEMAGDINPAELGGSIAGGMAADKTMDSLASRAGRYLGKNESLRKGAAWLRYRMSNPEHWLHDSVKGAEYSDFDPETGEPLGLGKRVLNAGKRFLADNLPPLASRPTIQTDSLESLGQPGMFTNAANKSIVEIIPGFLARIHREINALRTGKEAPLLAYDFSSNSFSDKDTIAARARGEVISPFTKSQVDERIKDLLDFIDPDGSLDEESREEVKKHFVQKAVRNDSTDSKALMRNGAFSGMSTKSLYKLKELLSQKLSTDEQGNRDGSVEGLINQNKLSELVREIGRPVSDPRALLQRMANLGQIEILRQAGLLEKGGTGSNLDVAEIQKAMFSHSESFISSSAGPQGKPWQAPHPTQTSAEGVGRAEALAGGQPRIQVESLKFDPKLLQEPLEKLQKTIRDQSPLEIVKTISEAVLRIEQQLKDGIVTADINQLFEGAGQRVKSGAKGFFGFGSRMYDRTKKGFADLSIRDLAQRGLGAAKDLGGRAMQTSKTLFGVMKGVNNAVLNAGKSVLGAVADRFGDIYIGSELMPRMTRAKLLAGKYRDKATGKVLKSFKDIRGAVIDEEGNVVLDFDEIKQATIRAGDKALTLIKATGGKLLSSAQAAGNLARRTMGGLYGVGIDLGIKAVKLGIKMLPPYDVYVKDELERPVLYASMMRLGDRYFSGLTGKPIKHPRDIDGPVKDQDGNFVVSEEQYAKGLVNRDNRSISNLPSRLYGKAARMAGKAIGVLKKAATQAWDVTTQLIGGLKEALAGSFGMIFGVKGEFLDTAKAQLETQIKIYNLLRDRLPAGVKGDSDGDGLRDGSAEEIRKKEAERLKTGLKDGNSTQTAQSNLGKMFAGLKGLFDRRKKDDDEDRDGDINVDLGDRIGGSDGDSDKKDKKKKKPKTPKGGKKGGFGNAMRRLGRGAGGLVRGAGRGIAGAATAAAGLLGSGAAATAGKTALRLGGWAARLGLSAAGVGLSTLGGLAGLSWGGLIGGLGAVLSAPVTLAALGVTAAAGLGYLGYKYLTRAKLGTLSAVRYAQYGFAKDDDTHLGPVFELERQVLSAVKFDEKAPRLDETKLNVGQWAKLFGVTSPNGEAAENWIRWFNNRFKPVYLAHLTVLRQLAQGVSLSAVDDKLTPEQKQQYLRSTSMPDGPYGDTTSPFEDLKSLPMGSYAVASMVDVAKAELEKEASKAKKPAEVATTAAAATAALTAKPGDKKPGDVISEMANKGQDGQDFSKLKSTLTATDVASRAEAGTQLRAQGSVADYIFTGQSGRLDAMTTVRMKCYGLVSMDVAKIKALRRLELETSAAAMSAGDGVKFNGDVEQILENVKALFGITGARSPRGYDWMVWYKTRFLPVYLTYLSGLERATGKKKPEDALQVLKPQDALNLANVLIGTTTVFEDRRVPIWQADKSPWDDYAVNLDPETVKPNIEFMTNTVKAVIAGEQKSAKVREDFAKNQQQAIKDGKAPDPNAMSETAGGAAVGMRKDPSTIRRDRSRYSQTTGQVPVLRPDGSGVAAVGDFVGGTPIRHPGNGTGGDVNKLPIPAGDGYANLKEMIEGAAKMVGVDPKALAAYIGVESNFVIDARPPIDRNTGRRASGATGLGQFIPGTWNEMLQKYGSKYGLAIGTPPEDPRANALMTAEYMRENTAMFKKTLGRDPTITDLYMAHFLGPAGARKFLSQDPDLPAYDIMGNQAEANAPIFLDRSGRPRTFGEIYSLLNKRIEKRMSQTSDATALASASQDKSSSAPAAVTPSNTTPAKTSVAATSPEGGKKLADAASTYVKPSAVAPNDTTVAQAPTGRKSAMPGSQSVIPDAVPAPAATAALAEDRLPTSRATPAPNPMRDFVRTPTASPSEVGAQASALAQSLNRGLDGVSNILVQQLTVQRNSEGLLRQLLAAVGRSGAMAATADTGNDAKPNSSSSAPTRVDREMPNAPVSMRKASYA